MLNILEKNKRKQKNCVINLTQRGLQGMVALADLEKERREGECECLQSERCCRKIDSTFCHVSQKMAAPPL